MNKAVIFALLIAVFYSCGSNDRGELVGVKVKKKWFSEKPFGMALIPGGSFTMGKQDEDIIGTLNTPTKTVTVRPYYMDETEVTNSEYKEFVHWVRDSIVRTELAKRAADEGLMATPDEKGEGPKGGIQNYKFKDTVENASPYAKFIYEKAYLNNENKPLNWEEDLIWEPEEYPDLAYVEVMEELYIPKEDAIYGVRTFDTEKLNYILTWFDSQAAAKNAKAWKGKNAFWKNKAGADSLDINNNKVPKEKRRRAFIKRDTLNIYPDTISWIKDFNYAYNDPMHQDYFSHQSYADYPVVGVSWKQARAFCSWRTKKKNDYLKEKKNGVIVPSFRLPTEAEWEYAARGGLEFATYPWGTGSATSDRGCFLANFKPVRGNYSVDGALYTVEAKSYNANDFGLYNMAGNVSEWTSSAYNLSSYYMASTMNPNVEDENNKRKIIRGGSWKDVAYFLEVSSRDYEYADTARSFIGFRTVQDFIGTDVN